MGAQQLPQHERIYPGSPRGEPQWPAQRQTSFRRTYRDATTARKRRRESKKRPGGEFQKVVLGPDGE